MTATDEIKMVTRVSNDGGDWIVKCPHCKGIVTLASGPFRGEQFTHTNTGGCGGWFEVSSNARAVETL